MLFFLACGSTKIGDGLDTADLEGVWQVDSIETYENDTLSGVATTKWLFELTATQILYCKSPKNDTSTTYYVIQKANRDPIFHVDSPNGVIESQLHILDANRFALIILDKKDSAVLKHWYHSRISRSEFESYCQGATH